MKATIYHNPRCSKSRQTLALLKEHDVELEIIEYLKNPPDKQTLQDILTKLGIGASDLIRKGEPIFKKLNLDNRADNPSLLLDTMVENPILIERPIVLVNDKVAIGRPPESVLDIL